jgi:Type II CAAX prenyl endopeptidase Rce1-like
MVHDTIAPRPTTARLLPPIFPILAVAGLLIALLLYRQTFREATIDLSISRADAEQRALEFLAGQGVAAGERWRSSSFRADTTAQDYLIASSGLAELDALAQQDLKLASWHVRLLTPLDPEEWSVDVSSRTGRIVSYQHVVKEEALGATIPITQAEQLALAALVARPGGGPAPSELRLLSGRVTRQPNRTDQAFTWERPALQRGDATYRYTVTLLGDQVGRIDEYYNIPESWQRLARWHARRGALLSLIGWTATYALMAGLGLAWLWAAGRRWLRLRFALTLLAAIGLVGLATALNSIPLLLASLPTNISVPAFLAGQLGAYAGIALMLGATVIVAGMAGEALVWSTTEATGDRRQATGGRRQANLLNPQSPVLSLQSPVSNPQSPASLSRALTLRGLASAPIARSLLIGICVGVAQLGYITLFYWAGQRWFGVWAPVDPNYDDALSTPLPWLYAIALGLLPAVGEELVFRLGGISLIQRVTSMPRLAVVTTAVIWASLHTTYSQQPFFIRLIELTIVGIVFGTLFLRYGVLSSMAAHYTYNSALMVPLLIQGSWATRAGALVAVSGAALLLLPVAIRRWRGLPLEDAEVLVAAPLPRSPDNRRWTMDDAPLSIGDRPSSKAETLFRYNTLIPSRSWHSWRWLLMLAVVGMAAWLLALWLLPQPPLLNRTQTRADLLARGAATARDLGLSTTGLYGAAYPDSALLNLDAEYLRDHPGAGAINQTVAAEGARAFWRVRFSQWDRDDVLSLWLGARGELIAFDHSMPEDAPGAAISQARARQLATELLERQRFDMANTALVESSTITRTNRVDHRFVWQSARIVGAAGHPRVLVVVQGDQVAALSPFLYTPPEYRRERDRTTIISMLQRDTLPLLPTFAALLLIVAGLLLATRHPPPLWLIIAAGLAGVGVTLLGGLLRLDAAQLAQPPRLIQGATFALLAALLAGAELALIAGGAAMLWARAFPTDPAVEALFGALFIRRSGLWRSTSRPSPEGAGAAHEGHLGGLAESAQAGLVNLAARPAEGAGYVNEGRLRGLAKSAQAGLVNLAASFSSAASARLRFLWSDGCRLGLALLPPLLAFGALRVGLNAMPGAVRSPGALGSFVPAATVLLEGALAALRATLLLAGSLALLASWRPLRPAALPLVTLGAVLVAAQPDRLALLGLALLAWPVAILLARRLRGNQVALLLALWWAACLPDALALFALDQWWYAANGALAIMALIAPILLLRDRHL